jgi:hypothetical protein
MTEDKSVPRVQGRVVGYIHWPGGRKEEIREETIHYDCSPEEKAELYAALKRQQEARRFEEAYQSSIPIVQELHRRMEQREIDDVAERLIRSAHE